MLALPGTFDVSGAFALCAYGSRFRLNCCRFARLKDAGERFNLIDKPHNETIGMRLWRGTSEQAERVYESRWIQMFIETQTTKNVVIQLRVQLHAYPKARGPWAGSPVEFLFDSRDRGEPLSKVDVSRSIDKTHPTLKVDGMQAHS